MGRTARVIYAQTDSLFMHVPNASAAQAVDVGKQTAKLVSAAFPKPMELKFENVSSPFMLLHVNRCASNCLTSDICRLLCISLMPRPSSQASLVTCPQVCWPGL